MLELTDVVAAVCVVDLYWVSLVTSHEEVGVVRCVVGHLVHVAHVETRFCDPVTQRTGDDLAVLRAGDLYLINEAQQGLFQPPVELIFKASDGDFLYIAWSEQRLEYLVDEETFACALGTASDPAGADLDALLEKHGQPVHEVLGHFVPLVVGHDAHSDLLDRRALVYGVGTVAWCPVIRARHVGVQVLLVQVNSYVALWVKLEVPLRCEVTRCLAMLHEPVSELLV